MALRLLTAALRLAAAVTLAAGPAAAAPTMVNEVVAVVEGAPITLWDLDVEARLRGLEQRGRIPADAPTTTDRVQALDQLVNRMLALRAADRFKVPTPGANEVEAELADLRTSAIGSLEDQLAAAGIPESRLRYRIQTKLRIRSLIQERLRDLVRVSDQDVADYLEEHPSAETGATDLVREYLTTLRLQERSRAFFNDLRERATVEILDTRFAPPRVN